jgi:hypothetical protein
MVGIFGSRYDMIFNFGSHGFIFYGSYLRFTPFEYHSTLLKEVNIILMLNSAHPPGQRIFLKTHAPTIDPKVRPFILLYVTPQRGDQMV